ARAFARQGAVHLPRDLGPTGIEPARSLLVRELVHVAQQRTQGAGLPPENSARGRALERAAVSVAAAKVTAAPHRPATSAQPHAHAAPVAAGDALVFGSPAPAPSPAAPAAVQRAPIDEPPAEQEQESKSEPLDLEDLARRLYPRIRPYLRKELSLDRERAGLALGTRR
ncbi:MAG TPA: hypothetical protein VHN37_09070, partial [Actinomycetota bacterium]|nr:hypothetical protein [Actinomycetota bacterium]